ncbi:MAG: carboxypeptidase-like regulatory domain-containing protein [Pseudomonadota bacterium]
MRRAIDSTILALLCSLLAAPGLAATVQGRVTETGGQVPIAGATVTLDTAPTDGIPDYTATTDALGRYFIEGVADGSYTAAASHTGQLGTVQSLLVDEATEQLNFQLGDDPDISDHSFRMSFDVHCVISQSSLPEAAISVEYRSANDAGAAPDEVYALTADGHGRAEQQGLEPGYYRFSITRIGWEAYSWPEDGSLVLVDADHAAVIGLKPVYQSFSVSVEGIRPDRPSNAYPTQGGIHDAFVEVTGLDLGTRKRVLAARTEITPESGSVLFRDLPSIPLELRVVKLGYEPFITYIDPNSNGSFTDELVDLQLHTETSIILEPSWIYGRFSPYQGFDAIAEGLPGSGSEGVVRSRGWSYEPGQILFDQLLPGRYRVRLWPKTYVRVSLSDAGFVSTDPDNYLILDYGDIDVLFEPVDLVIEVADREAALHPVFVEVLPVQLAGTLWAAEGGANNSSSLSGRRDVRPKAGVDIEIVPYGDADQLPPGVETVTVTTDAEGYFSANLVPGVYGLRAPGATAYTAFGMYRNYRILDTGLEVHRTQWEPWPAATPWPFAVDSHAHVGPPLALGSRYAFDMQLHIVKQVYRREMPIQHDMPSFNHSYLNPDLGLGIFDEDVLKSQTVIDVVGASDVVVHYDRLAYSSSQYRIDNLRPGHYEFRASHPINIFEADDVFTIDVYDQGAPGMPPPGNDYLGIEEVGSITGSLPEPSETGFYSDCYYWSGSEYLSMGGLGCIDAFYTVYDVLPGIFFETTWLPGMGSGGTYYFGNYDALNEVWYWTSGHLTAGATSQPVRINCGGPQDTFAGGGSPPPYATNIQVDVEIKDNWDQPVTGIRAEVQPGVYASHGDRLNISAPMPSPVTIDVLGWTASAGLAFHSNDPPEGRIRVRVSKTLEIAGHLYGPDGSPVEDAEIDAFNGFEQPLGGDTTAADGSYRIAVGEDGAEGIWLSTSQRGYYPIRKKFTPPLDATALSGTALHLQPIAGPVLGSVAVDRFGVFLPGVLKSGSPEDFNADNAAGNLTATVDVLATARTLSYPVDAYAHEGSGTLNRLVEDPIAALYVLYPRYFSAAPGTVSASQTHEHVLGDLDIWGWETMQRQVRAGQDAAGDPLRVLQWRALEPVSGSTWHAEVPLWRLPPGEFAPLVVAVSAQGGVSTLAYADPGDHPILRGAAVPEWAQSMLNVIGTIDAYNLGDAVNNLIPAGPIQASGTFGSAIGIRPDQTLTYTYELGVTFKDAQDGPQSGLMSLAGGLIGLAATGKVKFDVDGGAGTVMVSGSGSLTAEAGDKLGILKPGIVRGFPVKPIQPSITVTSSIDNVAVVGDTGLTFPEYRLQRSIGGFISSGVKVDLLPLAEGIPVIGQALFVASQLGAELNTVFKLGLGGTIRRVSLLARHDRGGTSTDLRPRLTSLFGDEEPADPPESFDFLSSAALEYVSPGALLTLSGGIQLGAQNDTSIPGLRVTFSTDDRFPFVRRVEGAVSSIYEIALKVAGVGFSKKFQVDGLKIDWQSGTSPYMVLVPLYEQTEIETPQTATPSTWTDGTGVLVEDLYGAGSVELSPEGGLVYTAADPGRGVTVVMFAGPSDSNPNGFAIPVEVASAAGIVDVALAQRDDGSWLVAWSQVDAADLGNPFARTSLYFKTSADGSTWSAAQSLADPGGYAFNLRADASGTQTAVLWLTGAHAAASQTSADLAIVLGSTVDGVHAVAPAAALRDARLAGAFGSAAPEFTALVQGRDGTVQAHRWDGSQLDTATEVATEVGGGIALCYDADDAVIAVVERGGNLALASKPQGGSWGDYGDPLDDALAREAAIVSVSDGSTIHNIVAWLQSGERGLLRYAIIDDGAVWVDGPTDADGLPDQDLRELELAGRETTTPSAWATARAHGEGGDLLVQYLITMGQAVVSPDAGVAGDGGGTTADAGVDIDAGESVDAAGTDRIGSDAAGSDAGTAVDAASVDSNSAADAGAGTDAARTDAAGSGDQPPAEPGCGCQGTVPRTPAGLLLMLGARMLTRPLRRRRP